MIFPRRYRLTLEQKTHLGDNAYSLSFKANKKVKYIAGQHFFFHLPHKNTDNRGTVRIFSIASSPLEDGVLIGTRYFGDDSSSFKRALFNSKPGDQLTAYGPSPVKDWFHITNLKKTHVFVVGGIGITPVRSVFADLHYSDKNIVGRLLFANKSSRFPFADDLKEFTDTMKKFSIEYFDPPKRINISLLAKTKKYYPNATFYLSGSPSFIKAMETMLVKVGVEKKEIVYDQFAPTLFGIVLLKGY